MYFLTEVGKSLLTHSPKQKVKEAHIPALLSPHLPGWYKWGLVLSIGLAWEPPDILYQETFVEDRN